MKQILQSLKTGETVLENVPCPKNNPGTLLIETRKTLVSSGTEKMLLEFGKASLLGKIKQQPDKVKMVLDKIKTDGLATTLEAVRSKLDQPIPLGYCNIGKVLEVGSDIIGFKVGDRVISNGNHAEIVRVPKNLCAKVPDNVSDESAAFTVLASIALQGVRLSLPTLGERYVVIGLGLIGLITVQFLKANGCNVLGADFDRKKCKLAEQFGAQVVDLSQGGNIIDIANTFSSHCGVDAVIITAATKSNEPLHQAATMCRKRGRIILVGVIGKEFSRADFYEKELTFQVSCSYGPGRYDECYEQKGQDYPIGFVRWTEQRNFEAVLEMLSSGVLNVTPLITNRFTIDQAVEAYHTLEKNSSSLGILLEYSTNNQLQQTKIKPQIVVNHCAVKTDVNAMGIGLIGAGNYGARTLGPAFKKTDANLVSVVSSQGISGKLLAKKLGFVNALTDEKTLYTDSNINLVVIVTRHNMHAPQVIQALKAGKHVFVEKPLAVTLEELEQIEKAYGSVSVRGQFDNSVRVSNECEGDSNASQLILKTHTHTKIPHTDTSILMVGFNRRFAPQVKTIKKLLQTQSAPKSFIMIVNAGMIPQDHWIQDRKIGAGRIIGEACHFIDLLRFLAGSKITNWHAISVNSTGICDDKTIITLSFEDGSIGSIHYLANGHKSFPKERLEVFCDGKILQLDNFRKLIGFGWKNFKKHNLRRQNKGQNECVAAFIDAIKDGKPAPIDFNELIEVSRVTIEIGESLQS